MREIRYVFVFFVLFVQSHRGQNGEVGKGNKIILKAADGVPVTADLYLLEYAEAPIIILCHQAGYSRGEYLSIVPKLQALGFSCIALDQRSGKEVNGVVNKTHLAAVERGKPTKYLHAIPDIETVLDHVKNNLKSKRILIWGSSYSAALVFYIGSQYAEDIDALLAFSPGEYVKAGGEMVRFHAAKVTCPVFVSSATKEQNRWKEIYANVKGEKAYYVPEEGGFHGSKALWPANDGNEVCWKAVEVFLSQWVR